MIMLETTGRQIIPCKMRIANVEETIVCQQSTRWASHAAALLSDSGVMKNFLWPVFVKSGIITIIISLTNMSFLRKDQMLLHFSAASRCLFCSVTGESCQCYTADLHEQTVYGLSITVSMTIYESGVGSTVSNTVTL